MRRNGDPLQGAPRPHVEEGRLPAGGAPADRIARALAFLLHPLTVGSPVALFYALRREGWSRRLVETGGIVFFLCAILPVAYLLVLRRLRLIHDLRRREDRRWVYPFLALCVVASLGVFWVRTEDPVIRASAATAVALVAILGGLNRRFKVSFHVAGTTAVLTAALFGFGRGAAPALLLVLPLAWARVRTGDHSLREVIAGLVVGALFPLLVMGWALGGFP